LYDKKHENRFTINLILKKKLHKTLILNDEIKKKNQKIKKRGKKYKWPVTLPKQRHTLTDSTTT
jgi:hypothetical protein